MQKLVVIFHYKEGGYERSEAERYPKSYLFSHECGEMDILSWLLENTSYDILTDDFFAISMNEPQFAE